MSEYYEQDSNNGVSFDAVNDYMWIRFDPNDLAIYEVAIEYFLKKFSG